MRDFLTPKQVARAIQVSESSVKRWCDKGVIESQYTAGGHRRIGKQVLLDFLRTSNHKLVDPEVLGLPATSGQTAWVVDRAVSQLTEALVIGAEDQVRQIVFDLYLAERSLCTICDQVFAESFRAIGELWECGDAEVYQERRGCEQTLRVLHELRALLAAPPKDAPVAIGGAVEGDQYNLATTMVELVLRDCGWNSTSLGDNLPLASLAAAIEKHRPDLFWISASHLMDPGRFLKEYAELYEQFGDNVAFVVGGQALNNSIRQEMKYAAFCDNLQHLETFAQTLFPTVKR